MDKVLYIVGQYKSGEYPNIVWEFQGVFDTEEKAIEACRDRNYHYSKWVLNEQVPHETFCKETFYPIQ